MRRKRNLDIKQITIAIAVLIIFALAFIYFEDVDEPLRRDDDDVNNIGGKPGFGAVFIVLALLTIRYIIMHYKKKR